MTVFPLVFRSSIPNKERGLLCILLFSDKCSVPVSSMVRIFLMWVKESFVIRISGSSSNLRLAESQISGWVSGIAANTFSGSEAMPVCPVEEMIYAFDAEMIAKYGE